MTALLTLNSFDNILYYVFKVTLDREDGHITKNEQYMVVKLPKRTLNVSYCLNMIFTSFSMYITLFYSVWYKNHACEKIKSKVFTSQEDFEDFWSDMISQKDFQLLVALIMGFANLLMVLTMFFGMPLVDCIQNMLEKCGCVCCMCFKRTNRADSGMEQSEELNIPHAEAPTRVMHFSNQNHETIDP